MELYCTSCSDYVYQLQFDTLKLVSTLLIVLGENNCGTHLLTELPRQPYPVHTDPSQSIVLTSACEVQQPSPGAKAL